jgi:hypothetical protein
MTTAQVLGIITISEMILIRDNYEANAFFLWILYGIYKVVVD